MTGFLAVARREMRERRGVFPAAAILGLLPFFMPLLSGVRHYGSADVRLYSAAFLAIAFAAALSLVLGTTAIGRDLSEHRLGFYFARPISSGAIWTGKLAGAWLQTALAALLVLLPAGVYDRATWMRELRSTGFAAGAAVAFLFSVLVFLALGNVVSLALRSRSIWVAGDLIAAAAWLGAMWWIAVPLLRAEAPVAAERFAVSVLVACSAALLASGGAQVSVGRVDATRGNRVRFAVLWSLLLLISAASLVYVRWLLSPGPGDLTTLRVEGAAARGSWITLGGWARNRADVAASFFYDVASGRFVRAGVGREGTAVLSQDGTTAVWTQRAGLDRQAPQEVWVCRLGVGDLRPVRTSITASPWSLELSPKGSRLAVADHSGVSVYDVASGRLLSALPLGLDRLQTLRFAFADHDHLLLYRTTRGDRGEDNTFASIEILSFDVSARKVSRTAVIGDFRRPFTLAFDDRRERLIVWEQRGDVSLFDASSGARVASLGESTWDPGSRAFLSDGRPVLAEATGGTGRLHLFTADGRPERVFDLGRAGFVRIGAEPEAGKLTLSISPTPLEVWASQDSFLLDLGSGVLRKVANHAYPVAANLRWRLPRMEPGSEATRLFWRNDYALARLDPTAGLLKPLPLGR